MIGVYFAGAPLQLERSAQAYDLAGYALESAAAERGAVQHSLHHVLRTEWESPAGRAFQLAVQVLQQPVDHLGVEAGQLAAECRLVAGELRELAERARQLQQVVGLLSNPAARIVLGELLGTGQLDWVWQRASEALHSAQDTAHYLRESGGVPWILRAAAALL